MLEWKRSAQQQKKKKQYSEKEVRLSVCVCVQIIMMIEAVNPIILEHQALSSDGNGNNRRKQLRKWQYIFIICIHNFWLIWKKKRFASASSINVFYRSSVFVWTRGKNHWYWNDAQIFTRNAQNMHLRSYRTNNGRFSRAIAVEFGQISVVYEIGDFHWYLYQFCVAN